MADIEQKSTITSERIEELRRDPRVVVHCRSACQRTPFVRQIRTQPGVNVVDLIKHEDDDVGDASG